MGGGGGGGEVRESTSPLQRDGARQGEGKRPMGAVKHICIWKTLFWFGQMWELEAQLRSQM